MPYTILAVNPGSTSMKIALYEDEKQLFAENQTLDRNVDSAKTLFNNMKNAVIETVNRNGYSMSEIHAYAGRSGKMAYGEGGAYAINDLMLQPIDLNAPAVHPSIYSPLLIKQLADEHGAEAYVINSQALDEFELVARVSGFPNVWRKSSVHALNHKEVGARAANQLGKTYAECNLVIAHLGGGITIAAHKHGRIIDSTSGGSGDGPIAPTRAGTVPVTDVIEMCFSGKYSKSDLLNMTLYAGGLKTFLGTADAREVEKQIAENDSYAKLVYDAMIYQIGKYIGEMAVVLKGKVDGICLAGGMAHSKYLVGKLQEAVGWIAPIMTFTDDYEMDALSNSVLRILQKIEPAKEYTGKAVFDPNEFSR